MSSPTPLGWQYRGACNGTDPELFFPLPTETEKVEQALSICARCEVTDACLQSALDSGEQFGVWGGRTEAQRSIMADLRKRTYTGKDERDVDHGTQAGARWHQRHKHPLCDRCRIFENARRNELKRAARERQKIGA